MFSLLRGILRGLLGRCPECGAQNWRARNNGWTVPEPVCGGCGYGADAADLACSGEGAPAGGARRSPLA